MIQLRAPLPAFEASALSGYAGPYAFSIIVGGRHVNQAAAHALQDRIAQYLAREA